MKTKSKILIIVFCIFIFLISDQIRVLANSTEVATETNLDVENLIDYINNLDLSSETIESISEKSQAISGDIKENATFKDYKLSDVIRIYKNFTSLANDLDLNIDFSIMNGSFTLKDKANGNSIFKGNIGEIKKYFQAIKGNTNLLTMEVLASIDNEELKSKIEEYINTEEEANEEILDEKEETEIDNKNIIENDNSQQLIDNNLATSKSSNMTIPISIVVIAFFVIVISYIKMR
ncbi:MAG: hypothetical protein E7212_11465 [Clostridium sartagoforme]|nr:hypothetical protein [Clostridium sartagoforme]